MKDGLKKASGERLVAFLERDLDEAVAMTIEGELTANSTTRAHVEQLERIRCALAGPLPGVEDIDLSAPIMRRVRAESRSAPPRRLQARLAPAFGGLLLAAAACLAIVQALQTERPRSPDAQLQPRSIQIGAGEAAPDGTGVRIYTVGADAAARSFHGKMRASDGLVFSYVNSAVVSFKYLMIFAQDRERQLRWYFPAFEKLGSDPVSIPIEVTGHAPNTLGEVIEHDLVAGPMTLYAVFSNTPLHVQSLEEAVRRGVALRKFLGSDTAVHVIHIEVLK